MYSTSCPSFMCLFVYVHQSCISLSLYCSPICFVRHYFSLYPLVQSKALFTRTHFSWLIHLLMHLDTVSACHSFILKSHSLETWETSKSEANIYQHTYIAKCRQIDTRWSKRYNGYRGCRVRTRDREREKDAVNLLTTQHETTCICTWTHTHVAQWVKRM